MYGYVQGCHLMSLVATVMAEGVLRSTAAKCQKSIRIPGKRNLEFKKSSIQLPKNNPAAAKEQTPSER
jgi:hypothetical protein